MAKTKGLDFPPKPSSCSTLPVFYNISSFGFNLDSAISFLAHSPPITESTYFFHRLVISCANIAAFFLAFFLSHLDPSFLFGALLPKSSTSLTTQILIPSPPHNSDPIPAPTSCLDLQSPPRTLRILLPLFSDFPFCPFPCRSVILYQAPLPAALKEGLGMPQNVTNCESYNIHLCFGEEYTVSCVSLVAPMI